MSNRVKKQMDGQYYIYILTNKNNTVLYTGQTFSLLGRVYQHKQGLADGFSKRYNLNKFVYFECAEDVDSALYREKQIKGYSHRTKVALVESLNPGWTDLTDSICE
jgi:putative endonuclease